MTTISEHFPGQQTGSEDAARGVNPGISFSCPHCGQHLSADYDMAGLSLACPTCGQSLVVPSLRKKASTTRLTPVSPNIRTTGKGRKWRRIVFALLIVSTIAGVVFMAHRCNGLTEDNGAIAAVLEQDRQIAVEAPKCNDLNDVDSATKRTYFIVGQMYRMDLSNCPDDFAQAYDNHRKAWQELLEVFYDTKRYQLRLGAGCLLVLFNGTSGRNSDFLWELDGEQKQLVKRYQDANKGIAETFDKVLGTATKHGVKTAQYRNPAFQ